MSVSGKIVFPRSSLNLKLMLEGGQCFRWRKVEENKWTGVASRVLWSLTQQDDHFEFTAKSSEKIDSAFCQRFLRKYLRLDEDLETLYSKWSKADEHFAKLATGSSGLRILDQEPIENLFSFICSSNNNIVRISSMVEKMCRLYGDKVAENGETEHYCFPRLERLSGAGVEEALRAAGFGYRAKYIHKSAVRLMELGGEQWLATLARCSYADAKASLLQLEGVGPKVADCICLMSLGHLCAVPVDTHVFQIAAQHYLPQLRAAKTCTPKIYSEICDHFVKLYGPYAGWAHCILFCADLKMFKEETGRKPTRPKKILHASTDESKTAAGNRRKVIETEANESNMNGRSTRQARGRNRRVEKDSDENAVKRTKLNQGWPVTCSGRINVPRRDLNLLITLNSGQTYRWNRIGEDEWKGIFDHKLWTLRQYDDKIHFKAMWSSEDPPASVNRDYCHYREEGMDPVALASRIGLTEYASSLSRTTMVWCNTVYNCKDSISPSRLICDPQCVGSSVAVHSEDDNVAKCELKLRDYFRLDFPLESYYSKWSAADNHFARIGDDFHGLRMIKQDPVENTFAFICSSNNTISRMRSMVEFLCSQYGKVICTEGSTTFHDFPKFDNLASDENLQSRLVSANFGFRARYVAGSVAYIAHRGGMVWFDELVAADYTKATAMLTELPGVGRKVADCICLTALDHLNTIPVDTHVYQVAARYYLPHLRKKKSVTAKSYDEIVKTFTTIFGAYCGWAHTVLFASDLQQHSHLHSGGSDKRTSLPHD